MKLLITFFLIVFIYAPSVYGGFYYVAQNSNGKGDGTSYADRMSVTTHNNNKFYGGDQIYLCGKIETQLIIPSSGEFNNPIIYRGYKSEPAIFTGQYTGQILGIGKSYITIDQIEFDGTGNNGTTGIQFANNFHYITITRCLFHDMVSNESKKKNAAIFLHGGSSSGRNSNIIIGGGEEMGNEIYNIGVDTGDSDVIISNTEDVIISYNRNYGKQDKSSGIDGLTILSSNRILIEKNKLFGHDKNMSGSGLYHQSDHGEDGIDLKGVTEAIVRYNVIHGNRSVGINVNRDDPVKADCNNILIYNNLIYNNGVNINFAGSYVDEIHSNIHVWGNILHSATGTQNLSSSTRGKNFYIYNNTLYNPLSSDRFQISAKQDNFNIKNNIFIRDNSRRQLYLKGETTRYTVDGNLYYRSDEVMSQILESNVWKTAITVDKNGEDADPRFFDIKGYDFRLKNDSPAINTGVTIKENPPSITIYGTIIHSSYANILSPTTDWSVFPPKVNIVKQDDSEGGWVKGAYGVHSSVQLSKIDAPENIIVIEK